MNNNDTKQHWFWNYIISSKFFKIVSFSNYFLQIVLFFKKTELRARCISLMERQLETLLCLPTFSFLSCFNYYVRQCLFVFFLLFFAFIIMSANVFLSFLSSSSFLILSFLLSFCTVKMTWKGMNGILKTD